MIEWWWLPAVIVGMWLGMVTGAVMTDVDSRDHVRTVALTVACAPFLLAAWVLLKVDVGVVPLSPRALARFADQRRVDKRPAWLFYVRGRGVLFLRKWELGDGRVKVHLVPEWQSRSRRDEPINVRPDEVDPVQGLDVEGSPT